MALDPKTQLLSAARASVHVCERARVRGHLKGLPVSPAGLQDAAEVGAPVVSLLPGRGAGVVRNLQVGPGWSLVM